MYIKGTIHDGATLFIHITFNTACSVHFIYQFIGMHDVGALNWFSSKQHCCCCDCILSTLNNPVRHDDFIKLRISQFSPSPKNSNQRYHCLPYHTTQLYCNSIAIGAINLPAKYSLLFICIWYICVRKKRSFIVIRMRWRVFLFL